MSTTPIRVAIVTLVLYAFARLNVQQQSQQPDLSLPTSDDGRALAAASYHSSKSSWQPTSSAVACPRKAGRLQRRKQKQNFDKKPTEKDLFQSQFGEDVELMKWFGHLCNGTYLEAGGLDGFLHSNTYAFNKGLEWKGILVEASPRNYQELTKNRPNEIANVHAGICDEHQSIHWVEGSKAATGGFLEFASARHRELWFTPKAIEQAQEVECKPLTEILNEALPHRQHIDFFSLDIEGAEYSALSTVDFDQISFGIIVVESNPYNEMKNLAVRSLLESNGYQFFQDLNRSYWFFNKDWANIYKDLVYTA